MPCEYFPPKGATSDDIWVGDFLMLPDGVSVMATKTVRKGESTPVEFHPNFDVATQTLLEPLTFDQAVEARKRFSDFFLSKGITPTDLAKALYPDNWR